jgi:hypothetical protein
LAHRVRDETDIDALLSPTHLLLFLGVFLIVTSPFRAAWSDPTEPTHPSLSRFLPILMSATLATALTAFMFMYLSPFFEGDMGRATVENLKEIFGDQSGYASFMNERSGIAAALLTTLFLFIPALILLKKWTPPVGSFAIMFGFVALLIQGITAFARPAYIIAGVAGGLAADLLARKVTPGAAGQRRLRMFALAGPVLLWGLYVLAVTVTEGLGWQLEIWTGTLLWAGWRAWD